MQIIAHNRCLNRWKFGTASIMEALVDLGFLLSAAIVTILAGFISVLLFKKKSVSLKAEGRVVKLPAEAQQQAHKPREQRTNFSEEKPSDLKEPEAESTQHTTHSSQDVPRQPRTSQQPISESQNTVPTHAGESMASEDPPLRYMPGTTRANHLEKMMSKDELEEEQRVQRDQLAAIFKLLKENQETFGEVTEKDMEEQLKLYSI